MDGGEDAGDGVGMCRNGGQGGGVALERVIRCRHGGFVRMLKLQWYGESEGLAGRDQRHCGVTMCGWAEVHGRRLDRHLAQASPVIALRAGMTLC